MVKHNNVTPNQHYHKQWATRVRTWFDQPAKKQARRLARKAKAAKIAPRPTQLLRPAVHCPTLKYNTKVRLGKGFTLEELKEAGVSRKLALTIGIAVDHRRQNKSVEAFETNVARLKAYKSKLIVFPRRSNQKPKAGDAKPEETAAAVQATGVVLPLAASAPAVSYAKVTPEMKEFKAYATLRTARTDVRMAGIRQKKKDGK
ncbi:unnamed protein product, partial [Phaeothamnion confervicola]